MYSLYYCSSISVVPVAKQTGLNHGIELSGGYLYASTQSHVYRWPYTTGQLTDSSAGMEVVIDGMETGGHPTRTLAFDSSGTWLYVSIGSEYNVDSDSSRARIRRFNIANWNSSTQGPLNFHVDGELFADGLRNEVGLAFDSFGDLWGVENGADMISDDNPSEEMNRFRVNQTLGKHYGYPYCYSEYCLPIASGGSGVKGANTIWAYDTTMWPDKTNKWCRENTVQAALSMPAHSAPLGLTFFDWKNISGCVGGFPKSFDKFAFVAFHGSWNRAIPTGYKVVFVPFDKNGNPLGQPIDLFRYNGTFGGTAEWPQGLRPVDVQFDKCGRLFVTEDGSSSGSVIKITYKGRYDDDFVPTDLGVADGGSCLATLKPTSAKPTSSKPTTFKPTTSKPTTSKPTTTRKPMSSKPITMPTPTTSKPTTSKPTTSKPTTLKPTTSKPTTSKPKTSKPTSKPTTSKPTPKPTTSKPTSKPTTKRIN